jgi:hypothetical protein
LVAASFSYAVHLSIAQAILLLVRKSDEQHH